MRFTRLSSVTIKKRINGIQSVFYNGAQLPDNFDGMQFSTKSSDPFYLKYRTYNRGKGWLDYVLSTSSTDFAGWKGFPIEGLEIQVFDSATNVRIYKNYLVMIRAMTGGIWLDWVSNASPSIMEALISEKDLRGGYSTADSFAGIIGKDKTIEALEIQFYKDNYSNTDSDIPDLTPAAEGVTLQYYKNGAYNTLTAQSSFDSIDGLRLLTSSQKGYYFKYRTYNTGKGWLGYVPSTDPGEFAGWGGYPVEGVEIQVYDSYGVRIYNNQVVMYRAKTSGKWLPWVSNGTPTIMQELMSKYHLGGSLDYSSVDAGLPGSGKPIQALDIRVFEDVNYNHEGVEEKFAQYYREDAAWLPLTSNVNVTSMNSVRLVTSGKPYYLKYRTNNRGKGWLDYVLSTNSTDFAGWKGFPISGIEIQMFDSDGKRLFDTHAVMYRSKVAGEWLDWVSNVNFSLMQSLKTNHNLEGNLDATGTFSGWSSRGDIEALDIRIYENVGLANDDTGGTGGEIPDIPVSPNNPNGKTIFIDPGHGGTDPGAMNGSYKEKDYTLKLSMYQKELFERAGYRVVMSRALDNYITLDQRTDRANDIKADFFISNHINASTSSTAHGCEVYYQKDPDYTETSYAMASRIAQYMGTVVYNRGAVSRMLDDGSDDYYHVLRETEMPAVLVEHAFISSADDLAVLNDEEKLQKMAKAVVRAVCDILPNPANSDPTDMHLANMQRVADFLKYRFGTVGVDVNVLTDEIFLINSPQLRVSIRGKAGISLIDPEGTTMTFSVSNQKLEPSVSADISSFCSKMANDYSLTGPFHTNPDLNFNSLQFQMGIEASISGLAVAVGDGYITCQIDLKELLFNRIDVDYALTIRNKDITPDTLLDAYTTVHLHMTMQNWDEWTSPGEFPALVPAYNLQYAMTYSLIFLSGLGLIVFWPTITGAVETLTISAIGEIVAWLLKNLRELIQNWNSAPALGWVGPSLLKSFHL